MNPEKARDFKKRMLIGRTFSINEAMKGAKRPIKEKVNDDSIISREIINGVIETGIKEGKNKLEILIEYTNFSFPFDRFEFFEQQIDLIQ